VQRLWAPWRMAYIDQDKPPGCIFCTKPALGDDQANHIVWRGEAAFVLLNAYPYNNGHLMIAPFAHIGALQDVPLKTLTEIMSLAQDAATVFGRDFDPDGLNMGINQGAAAGAGVKDHLHLHIVPRWEGDTNFMPVTADIRVIPESLDRSWETLHDGFVRLFAERAQQAAG
jgi:ATP adenylyltransferase